MIRCTKCGTINADSETFCTNCSAFLEWNGVRVDDPAKPATQPPPVQPTPPTEPPPPTFAPAEPPSVQPTYAPPPPPTSQPQSIQPISRQPTFVTPPPKSRPQAAQSLATEPPIRPGDLICGVCGAGNSPDRRFCRRCGNSLVTATVAAAPPPRVPWYRRIFARSRQQQIYEAGERPSYLGRQGQPRPSRLKRVLLIVLVLVILLPIVGYLAVPAIHDQVNALIGSAGNAAILAQHPASAALDKDVSTYWLADPATGASTVTVNFTDTTDLAGLTFNGGATIGTDYDKYARPRQVQLIFPGDPQPVLLLLKDDPAPQQRCLPKNRTVSTFAIHIVDSYPPTTGSPDLVGMREIAFIAGSCS